MSIHPAARDSYLLLVLPWVFAGARFVEAVVRFAVPVRFAAPVRFAEADFACEAAADFFAAVDFFVAVDFLDACVEVADPRPARLDFDAADLAAVLEAARPDRSPASAVSRETSLLKLLFSPDAVVS